MDLELTSEQAQLEAAVDAIFTNHAGAARSRQVRFRN